MAKKLAAILAGAIAALGLAGILMGSGYIINERKKPEDEDILVHETMLKRERKTGWASIGAGVGVIAAGAAVYGIVAEIVDQLTEIRKAVIDR